MKRKAFLVINTLKDGSDVRKIAGVFWKKSNAKKFIDQLMEENADFIGSQLYKIEKFIFLKENNYSKPFNN